MTTVTEIKAIRVDELAEAFESFESERGLVSPATGSGKSLVWMLNFLRQRARPLTELVEENSESQKVLIIDTSFGLDRLQLLEQLLAYTNADRERFGDLIETLMPTSGVPDSAVIEQARQNAQARAQFLDQFPVLTSAEIAELSGSQARNRAALANAWRKQGRVFALSVSGQHRFPLFQFGEGGQPKLILADVLDQLREAGLDGWQIALWFTGALASLGGRRPVDLIDTDSQRVVEAASKVSAIPW